MHKYASPKLIFGVYTWPIIQGINPEKITPMSPVISEICVFMLFLIAYPAIHAQICQPKTYIWCVYLVHNSGNMPWKIHFYISSHFCDMHQKLYNIYEEKLRKRAPSPWRLYQMVEINDRDHCIFSCNCCILRLLNHLIYYSQGGCIKFTLGHHPVNLLSCRPLPHTLWCMVHISLPESSLFYAFFLQYIYRDLRIRLF